MLKVRDLAAQVHETAAGAGIRPDQTVVPGGGLREKVPERSAQRSEGIKKRRGEPDYDPFVGEAGHDDRAVDVHVVGNEDIPRQQVVILALDVVGNIARNKKIQLIEGMLVKGNGQGLLVVIVVEFKVGIHHILSGLELLSAAGHKGPPFRKIFLISAFYSRRFAVPSQVTDERPSRKETETPIPRLYGDSAPFLQREKLNFRRVFSGEKGEESGKDLQKVAKNYHIFVEERPRVYIREVL